MFLLNVIHTYLMVLCGRVVDVKGLEEKLGHPCLQKYTLTPSGYMFPSASSGLALGSPTNLGNLQSEVSWRYLSEFQSLIS